MCIRDRDMLKVSGMSTKDYIAPTSFNFSKRDSFATVSYTHLIEFADNRISLYAAQYGKCAVTGEPLMPYEIRCHHKIPIEYGGTDDYNNLVLVSETVHILIHSTKKSTIDGYLKLLDLNKKQLEKLNKLRELAKVEML